MEVSEGSTLGEVKEKQESVENNGGQEQVAIKKKRRIAIDYIIDKNYNNEYIQSWLSLPFIHAIHGDPNFHSFLNHNELKKEMTESYAVFVRVQQLIKRIYARLYNPPHTDNSKSLIMESPSPSSTSTSSSASLSTSTSIPPSPMSLEDFTENIVLFDVCSGKGYAATLLAFMFPKLKIFMIDKDTKMNLQHLTELRNVQMVHFDLFKKDQVKAWVAKQTSGKIGLFLGTHLCGELSEMFVDIYNSVNTLQGLVLAPCCLSKRKRIFADTAAKLKIDNYEYWTMHLYWMIQQSKKDISADENVFSLKNNYISAVKSVS